MGRMYRGAAVKRAMVFDTTELSGAHLNRMYRRTAAGRMYRGAAVKLAMVFDRSGRRGAQFSRRH